MFLFAFYLHEYFELQYSFLELILKWESDVPRLWIPILLLMCSAGMNTHLVFWRFERASGAFPVFTALTFFIFASKIIGLVILISVLGSGS